MNTKITPLGEAAKKAFHEYHNTNPDPTDDIWEHVARVVLRTTVSSTDGGVKDIVWAQLVASAIFMSIGEKYIADELMHGCLALHSGEPFFVLRGQDRLAPQMIGEWIKAAELSGTPEHKLDLARQVQESMERWNGDRKYPD